ncbi:MAG: 50S ribosomal protein L30 [Vicinamibacteria bacterium]|jgi:large subunit ribosomal protein L30|nr:50S ribosomal protein L30 [Vicinamibacteria bacterium]
MAAEAKKAKSKQTIKIQMIGSIIGCTEKQRANVRGLGLRRLHEIVEREDTPQVRGMVNKVPHLVAIVADSVQAKA